jgi:hypothetical protein
MEANVKTHRSKQGLKGIALHWDNAPSHTVKMTIAKPSELGMNPIPANETRVDNHSKIRGLIIEISGTSDQNNTKVMNSNALNDSCFIRLLRTDYSPKPLGTHQ